MMDHREHALVVEPLLGDGRDLSAIAFLEVSEDLLPAIRGAEMDVLAAVSACPAETSPTNNFRTAPLGIKVFG